MSGGLQQQLSVIHYFVDEAGDSVLFDRKGKVLVGENGCSKYFMLGKLELWRQVWSARQWQRKYLDFYTSPTKAEQRFLGKPHSAGTRPSVGLRSDDALPSPMTPSTRCAHRLVANRPIPRALFGDHKRHDFLTWWLFSKRAA